MNNSLVGIFSNDVFSDRKNYGFIKLPNPRTGTDAVYLWNSEKLILNEIQKFVRPYKAWVINENVISNPGFYVSSLIDPLFLTIPYLLNHAHHFSTIDTIMQADDYPQLWVIMSSIFDKNNKLEALTDCKRIDDETIVYKYNENKTLNWLKGKIDKLSKYFEEKTIVADDSNDWTASDEQYPARVAHQVKSMAIDIVSDYLTPDFEKLLKKHLNFEETPSCDLNPPPAAIVVSSPKGRQNKTLKAALDEAVESPPKKIARTPGRKPKTGNSPCLRSIENYFKKSN